MMRKHETVDDYINRCSETVVPLLEELREFIRTTLPDATECMLYGAPVFMNANGAPVIYLFGSKQHVNFGFLISDELTDPHGMLKGSGKPSKHITVFPDKPYDKVLLSDFVSQCAEIKG